MEIPPDLLDLHRAFLKADARCYELAAALPSARELIRGTCTMPADELERRQAELEEARRERLELVLAKARHPWWATVPDWCAADRAVRAAAKADNPSA